MKVREIKIIVGFVLLVMLITGNNSYAQQDPMYTQYIDNLQVVNPGYAGSKGIGSAMVVARSQWVSFDGAPATRSFAFNSPIRGQQVGIGFSLLSDKIGPLKQTGAYFDYSYYLRVSGDFRLGLGLKGGVSFYRANLSDLITIDPDPIFDNDIYENFLPNVGFGTYLYSDDMYFGFSVPKLIENRITKNDVATGYVNRQKMHIYLMGGKTFTLNEDISLKTGSMLRWVKSAPISLDITGLFGFKEKFYMGGMFRFGSSYGFLAQFKPTFQLTIGYSYDLTITELSTFHGGTHEIMLSYDFNVFE